MIAARSSVVFPALFTMMPLTWLKIGVPWLPLAITFGAIPLLDALAGARVPKPCACTHPALARRVPRGLALFLRQPCGAVVLLEVVNYIVHCGLLRLRVGEHYEPVDARHSWNADHTSSNWILFDLRLRSDHHAHVRRPYELLRSLDGAAVLPAGYPTRMPPLWFALMEPRWRPQEAAT